MSVIAVVGSAPCWLEDLDALLAMRSDVSVCVLNRSISLPITFEHFLTGHPEIFAPEVLRLKEQGLEFEAIGAERCSGYDTLFKPHNQQAWGGSVANAICLFRTRGLRVVLCGCPFDSSGHFNDPNGTYHGGELWDWFLRGHPHRSGYNVGVRSMSGQTRELFRYPTKEWLNEPC